MQLNKLILGLFLLFSFNNIFSQIERSEIIAAYIYNFAQLTNWPNESQLKSFNIGVFSDNNNFLNKLKKMSENQKIKDKSINIISLSNLNSPNTFQIIFFSSEKLDLYTKVYDQIEDKPILLISENYVNKRIVMINLYDTDDNNIQFEINKANIHSQNLIIDEKLLLLGGTEIDVAELYMKTKKSLRELEKESKNLKKELKLLIKEISKKNVKANDQDNVISTQSNILVKQKDELENFKIQQTLLQDKINNMSEMISTQKEVLKKDKQSISFLADSLNTSKKTLKDLKYDIEQANYFKQYLKIETEHMVKEITAKDDILGEQDKKIVRQERTVYLFGATIILILILLAGVFAGLLYRKRKNNQLQNQKEEIESINEELSINNKNLKIALKDLKKTQQQLVQSEKMASLGVLTAGIAHEINNPINFVYTGINSLQKDFNDINIILSELNMISSKDINLKKKIETIERLKKEFEFNEAYNAIPQTIKDIRLGANRTSEIIAGLRTFSRSDKNEVIDVDLNEIIDAALLMLRNKYKYHIKVIRNYDKKLQKLKCSPVKMTQVFINIVSNAIDAIKAEKGEITITTKQEKENIIISVKDTGVGIKGEIEGKIFDPFYTTKEIGKGTGLGLSITYGIIKEYNGDINVKSELNKGTEFIITLPII